MTTIRKARVSLGWNQAKLAVEAGVSIATISSVEQGKPVTRKILDLICAALGIAVDDVEGIKLYDHLDTIEKREAGRRESKRRLA